MMSEAAALDMRGIRKTFGPLVALDSVDLELTRGRIHGLLGGNGAGKTTLMNVLFGLYRPSEGSISVGGREVTIRSPRDAIAHKIGMVHQHFLQVDTYTVTENIVLGTDLQSWPKLMLSREAERVKALSERFGLVVDPDQLAGEMPIGVRQKVEILKALYRGIDILILDEPTTNLTPQEVDDLFESLRLMVDEGLTIVLITHKLNEVMAACDTITVLRNGRNVLSCEREDATESSLVEAMVGEDVAVEESVVLSSVVGGTQLIDRDSSVRGEPIVEVKALTATSEDGIVLLEDCALEIRPGEILGLAGVAGNGQQDLAECLMAIKPFESGTVEVVGIDVSEANTKQLLAAGIAYVPQDRLADGYLPSASLAHNLILGYHETAEFRRHGFLDWKKIFRFARDQITEYNIKAQSEMDVGATLSGGNIQRLMVARALGRHSDFLIAHNPTRGLDIPSMDFLYGKMIERSKEGGATLLISEDLDELFRMCDRIATIYSGRIVGEMVKGDFDKYEIGRMMSGVSVA